MDRHLGLALRALARRVLPAGLPERDELEYAAARFPTIELNGSFYSLQRPEYYERWYDQVPSHFLFAVKGSRYITHMKRLRDVETALANFFASGLLALEHKLGPLLWQLPPTLKFDERLEPFLKLCRGRRTKPRSLPAGTTRASPAAPIYAPPKIASCATRSRCGTRALRHLSSSRLLREQNIALVVADTAGRWPFLEDLTSDFVYVRLHGDAKLYESGYTDAALERWAERIRAWRDGRKPQERRTRGTTAAPRQAARRLRLLRQRHQSARPVRRHEPRRQSRSRKP